MNKAARIHTSNCTLDDTIRYRPKASPTPTVSIKPVLMGRETNSEAVPCAAGVEKSSAAVIGVGGYSPGSGTVNCCCARVSASWCRAPVMRRLVSCSSLLISLRVVDFSATHPTLRQEADKLAHPNGAVACRLLLWWKASLVAPHGCAKYDNSTEKVASFENFGRYRLNHLGCRGDLGIRGAANDLGTTRRVQRLDTKC